MTRVHNELQNALYQRLQKHHGDVVFLEADNIDICVRLPSTFVLIEVKASPSPTHCVREALGQMLYYAWRCGEPPTRIKFVVVGPTTPSLQDTNFVHYICQMTGLTIAYCTPETYELHS